MISFIEYVLTLLVVVIAWLLYSLGGLSIRSYFRTGEGKGILKGIVLALGVAIGLAVLGLLTGCSGKFINDASVYAGLDRTKKESPQCDSGGVDSYTTSNLGFELNIYESADSRFRTNLRYLHHSCAFTGDDRQYDALGIQAEYKLWSKK